MNTESEFFVSAIVPTIGRPESLRDLLASLCLQTRRPDEVIVADGSNSADIEKVVELERWFLAGLNVRRITVSPPNAVRQRMAAITVAAGEFLLLLDDDVVLESDCLERLLTEIIRSAEVVATVADFSNQRWSGPTTAWRLYLRLIYGFRADEWQGKVIGPLLRFGFPTTPAAPTPMEWIGAGNSLVRRSAFERVGGFSDFFLRRCTINEDVDLGLKLGTVGNIIFCPRARLAHHHAPSGRVTVSEAAEDDIHNRFMVLHQTAQLGKISAVYLTLTYFIVETLSNFVGAITRGNGVAIYALFKGRLRGIIHIARFCIVGYSRK